MRNHEIVKVLKFIKSIDSNSIIEFMGKSCVGNFEFCFYHDVESLNNLIELLDEEKLNYSTKSNCKPSSDDMAITVHSSKEAPY